MSSPIPKLPLIIEYLNEEKRTIQASINDIRLAIIWVTGATKEETIKKIFGFLLDFGYIKKTDDGNNLYYLYQKKKRYFFPQIEQQMNMILNNKMKFDEVK